jgi:AAA domain
MTAPTIPKTEHASEPRVRVVREPVDATDPIQLRRGKRMAMIDAIEIAKPLPPVEYLVDALGITCGPPTCIAGFGYSRKTMALQDLVLSVASGKPLWGVFKVRKGRALHVDYEQGPETTRERYQRLAKGAGIELAELGDALELVELPDAYLDEPGGEEAYLRTCDGFDLVIIDSFRAACPNADENKSDIRKHIDKLTRISAKTGAAFVLIHHANKPQPQQKSLPGVGAGQEDSMTQYSPRGSGAIFDAMQSFFVFQGERNMPTRVVHVKDRRRGQTCDPFGVTAEDFPIEGYDHPKGGLRMLHLDKEQMRASRNPAGEMDKLEDNMKKLIAFLKGSTYRRYEGTKDGFRAMARIGAADFRQALAVLIDERKVIQDGKFWTLADGL